MTVRDLVEHCNNSNAEVILYNKDGVSLVQSTISRLYEEDLRLQVNTFDFDGYSLEIFVDADEW